MLGQPDLQFLHLLFQLKLLTHRFVQRLDQEVFFWCRCRWEVEPQLALARPCELVEFAKCELELMRGHVAYIGSSLVMAWRKAIIIPPSP